MTYPAEFRYPNGGNQGLEQTLSQFHNKGLNISIDEGDNRDIRNSRDKETNEGDQASGALIPKSLLWSVINGGKHSNHIPQTPGTVPDSNGKSPRTVSDTANSARSGRAHSTRSGSDDYYDLEAAAALDHSRRFSAGDIFRGPYKANSSLQRPFFQRFLNNKYSVTNPNSPFDLHHHPNTSFLDTSSVCSIDIEEQQRRLAHINSLRPQKLIGNYKSLANWMVSYRNDVKSIKNKKLRKFYEDQNHLIERFTEIDNFLDAGKIHYNMLSTYGNLQQRGFDILDPHDETPENNQNIPNGNQYFANEETPLNLDLDNTKYQSLNLEPNDESYNTHNSKKSRFHDLPGNITEGAKFLGYDEKTDQNDVYIAILVNFFINFILLIGKFIVSILTNSMSVVASLVDSILDFLSTFIIFFANRLSTAQNAKSQHAYPVGRSRLEPLGVLIFSIIIILAFFQVGQESFKRLFLSDAVDRNAVKIGWDAVLIMTITIISKICCWVWCSSSKSSSVQALAQDAMTDIIFNIVSLLMPSIGFIFNIWWLDPLGALLLSIYIIASWSATAYEHIDNLTGAVADPLDYQVILYLAYRFAESIKQITALKVYHVGDNVNVEIDVIFNYEDLDLNLKDCHDIAEALQYSIETLPMVERAFVHIEYMEGNFKGHLQ